MIKEKIINLLVNLILDVSLVLILIGVLNPIYASEYKDVTNKTGWCHLYSAQSWGGSYSDWYDGNCMAMDRELIDSSPMAYYIGLTYSPNEYLYKDHDYEITLALQVQATDFSHAPNTISPDLFNATQNTIKHDFYYSDISDLSYLYPDNEWCLRWQNRDYLGTWDYAQGHISDIRQVSYSYLPVGDGWAQYNIKFHFHMDASGFIAFRIYFQNKDLSINNFGAKVSGVSNLFLHIEQDPDSTPLTNDTIFDKFFNTIEENNVITELITLPITLFSSISSNINGSCSSYNLGSFFGTNIILPCINVATFLGDTLWGVIDMLFSGIFIYTISKKMIKVFYSFTSMEGGDVLDR